MAETAYQIPQWSCSVMTGTDILGAIAHPSRWDDRARGKLIRGELYGRIYPTSDAAWKAMHDRGYRSYRRMMRPSGFIGLRLSPRTRKHAAWLYSAHGEDTALEFAARMVAPTIESDPTGYVHKVLYADYMRPYRARWTAYLRGIHKPDHVWARERA